MNTDQTSAQTNQIVTANTDIAAAFHSIQTAEQQGASNSDLLPLVNQLNTALQYEEDAAIVQSQNMTLADSYANKSIALSTTVSMEAAQLGSTAQREYFQRSVLGYSVSLLGAVIAAYAVIEAPRLKRYLVSRKIGKARIDYGGREHGQ